MELGAPVQRYWKTIELGALVGTTKKRHHGELGAPAGATVLEEEDGAWCSEYSKTMELGAPDTRRARCVRTNYKKTDSGRQSQSVVLQETRWSLVLRQEEEAHRNEKTTGGGGVVLQEWVLGESHGKHRGANRSHIVRWESRDTKTDGTIRYYEEEAERK
jgi:hypothetical protein